MNIFELIYEILMSIVETILGWILPSRYKSVEGEICLITGAGSGMGRLMALEFAQRKAKLVLWDIDEQANEQTGVMVREIGASVFTDVCDLSQKEEIKKAAKRAREQFGDITILVNNAGITYCKQLLELSERQIEQTFNVNVLAHFWTLREFLPSMMKRNHGHVVTTASSVGLFPYPGMNDYSSSKYAAVGLHQSLYLDLQLGNYTGVKTTLVCPYLVTTGMFKGLNTPDLLFRPLEPKECVEAIMHAILTDRPFVATPRAMYLAYINSSWASMRLQVAVTKLSGADKAMKKFVPNRKYQLEVSES